MDYRIALSTLVSFFVFLVLQVIVFRLTRPERALTWIIKLTCIIEGSSLIIGSMLWESEYPTIALIHACLFLGASGVYTLTVFSFSEASLTMGILSQIVRSGRMGVTHKELQKNYSVLSVVRRRLRWLLAGGEIVREGASYRWNNSFSLFVIREHLGQLFLWLFPRMQ